MHTRLHTAAPRVEALPQLPGGTPQWTPLTSEDSSEAWEGPTLHELANRVEHQFGDTPGLAGIYTLGFGRDELLTPGDIRSVCDHLGLPAEDFGIAV